MLVSRRKFGGWLIFISAITYKVGSLIERNKAYVVQEIYKMMCDIQLQHACT